MEPNINVTILRAIIPPVTIECKGRGVYKSHVNSIADVVAVYKKLKSIDPAAKKLILEVINFTPGDAVEFVKLLRHMERAEEELKIEYPVEYVNQML